MTQVQDKVGAVRRPRAAGMGSKWAPVIGWATVGAVFLIIQIAVYGGWILSGDAYSTTTGPDLVPTMTKVWAWLLQGVAITTLVTVIVYCWRRSRREGRLCFDALAAIGFVLVYWQDTGLNYLRPTFLYNSYLVNLGVWNPHIPGWISPHARNLPEPLLFAGAVYAIFPVLFPITFCAVARRAHRRWPDIGKIGIFLVGIASLALLDMVLELIFIRTELFAYSGTIRALSLWGGQKHQFPLYEGLAMALMMGTVGMLRYHRDDRGRSRIERGCDDLRMSTRARSVVAVLAFAGLSNVTMLSYNVVFNWIALSVDTTPAYPSYLLNGMCGPKTDYPCPGPDVPIFSSRSLPNG